MNGVQKDKNTNKSFDEKLSELEEVGFILISKIRILIIYAMLKGCIFPSEIKRTINVGFPSISKNLSMLKSKGFITCINPKSKKGRIYLVNEITNKFKGIITEKALEYSIPQRIV